MKKVMLLCVPVLSLILSGCMIISNSTVEDAFCRDGKPKADKVGGGFNIAYTVVEEGTAVLVDERSGKTIRTVSMNAGEVFSFDYEKMDPQKFKELGIDLKKANFVLYFHPKHPKPQLPPSQPPQQ